MSSHHRATNLTHSGNGVGVLLMCQEKGERKIPSIHLTGTCLVCLQRVCAAMIIKFLLHHHNGRYKLSYGAEIAN